MANQPKKTQLLDRTPAKPKPKQKPKKKQPAQQVQPPSQSHRKNAAVKKKSGIVKKLMMAIVGLSILAVIIAPKPQLLSYKKLGLVANSIYMPGWFGQPGTFLDSQQRVVIDKQLGLVYLCYGDVEPKENCNRYQFIEQQGMFAALSHYQSN